MNTTKTTSTQTMLFPEMEVYTEQKHNYQIKKIDDSSFGLPLSVTGEEDPEILALERLGYFVVPESSIC